MSKFWRKEETFEAPQWGEIRTPGVPPLSELICLGWQEHAVEDKDSRTGSVTVKTVDYQLLRHRRHTGQVFIQWGDENGPIEPLQTHTGGGDKVSRLGTVRGVNRPSGRHLPAPDDRIIPLEQYTG